MKGWSLRHGFVQVQSSNNLAETKDSCNIGMTFLFLFCNDIKFLYTFRFFYGLVNAIKEAERSEMTCHRGNARTLRLISSFYPFLLLNVVVSTGLDKVLRLAQTGRHEKTHIYLFLSQMFHLRFFFWLRNIWYRNLLTRTLWLATFSKVEFMLIQNCLPSSHVKLCLKNP